MKDLRSCETSVNIYQPIQRNIPLYWNLYKRERLETGCAECHKKWMVVELVRNLVAHGDAREGKWRGNRRVEWVASTLTPPLNVVYPALLKLMRTPQLPAVDWTDAPTDLNGLVRFGERRNLVSARVPSPSARAILQRRPLKAVSTQAYIITYISSYIHPVLYTVVIIHIKETGPYFTDTKISRASALSRLHDHNHLQLDTPHSAGLLWTSRQPNAENFTWQHKIITRDRRPYSGGIRTRNSSKRAAADPQLRPSDHKDWKF